MRKYELTVVIRATLKGEAGEKFVEKLEKTVKAVGGKMGKTTEMGTKPLAYKIARQSDGRYLQWVLELPGESVVELEKKLNVDKDVLRHLVVSL